ncbi:MAG: very short patch repair endonuclease [Defluviitaleaceae bacterium]|nr:very short patch repair endonuclease [Defluviitaleaceae bacterium]
MDRHTPEQRRRNMQAVKNKDSQIETALRRELFRRGYRYRKNCTKIVGKPDIVFIKEKIAVFCDSEFWHGYDWENRKADIKSRREFWIPKIERNMERDREVNEQLEAAGYIVLRYWGRRIKKESESVADEIERVILARREFRACSRNRCTP